MRRTIKVKVSIIKDPIKVSISQGNPHSTHQSFSITSIKHQDNLFKSWVKLRGNSESSDSCQTYIYPLCYKSPTSIEEDFSHSIKSPVVRVTLTYVNKPSKKLRTLLSLMTDWDLWSQSSIIKRWEVEKKTSYLVSNTHLIYHTFYFPLYSSLFGCFPKWQVLPCSVEELKSMN